MLNKEMRKFFKISCFILASVIMFANTYLISTFAATKDDTIKNTKYGDLNVIVESSDNTVPNDATLKARFVTDDDLDFQASEYDNLCQKLDSNSKKNIERLGIFDLELIDKEGNKIDKLEKKTKVFIEVPKKFHKKDVQVVYISEGQDEQFEEKVVSRGGKDYVTFETDHFSPYALIDEETRGAFFSILGASAIGAILIAAVVIYTVYKKRNLNGANMPE